MASNQMSVAYEYLGFLFLCLLAWLVVNFFAKIVYTYAVGPILNKVDIKSKGKWAVVTGCTDGIGKEYARQLAAKGCDIVLISRSLAKLEATAQEIEKEFNVATKIIQADFSDGVSIYENIGKEVADLDIGTLVNNVAISYSYPEYFLDLPNWQKFMSDLITVNILSVNHMTALILPGMVKRKRGIIINLSSGSALTPSPMLTVYAATKAYVDKFTRDLEAEYKSKGIIIQSVLPGFVATNMSGIKRSSFFAPTAKQYVTSALALLGTSRATTGFLPHALMIGTVEAITNICQPFGAWLVKRNMEISRRKMIKKYNKTQ